MLDGHLALSGVDKALSKANTVHKEKVDKESADEVKTAASEKQPATTA